MIHRRIVAIIAVAAIFMTALYVLFAFARVQKLRFETTEEGRITRQEFLSTSERVRIDFFDAEGELAGSTLRLGPDRTYAIDWTARAAQRLPEVSLETDPEWERASESAAECEFARCFDSIWRTRDPRQEMHVRVAEDDRFAPVWIDNQNAGADGWMATLIASHPRALIVDLRLLRLNRGGASQEIRRTRLVGLDALWRPRADFAIPDGFRVEERLSLWQLPPAIREKMLLDQGKQILEAKPENAIEARPENR